MPNLPGSNPELATRKPATLPSLHRGDHSASRQPAGSTVSAQAATLLQRAVSPLQQVPQLLQPLLTPATPQPKPYDPNAVQHALGAVRDAEDQPEEHYEGPAARFSGGHAPGTRDQDIEVARATLDEALRTQRMEAIGANTGHDPKPGNIKKRTDVLSWDEYNALTERQRSAVDFNTMLVQAVRKDRRLTDEYKPTEVEQLTYDNSVKNMFGEDRGSDMYAPETMAVLRQIGYKDDQADLDDFLGLKAAIKTGDLKHLEIEQGDRTATATAAEGGNPLRTERVNLAWTLADKTAEMEAALAKGNALLNVQTPMQAAKLERNDDVDFMGGLENTLGRPAPGYGPDEVSGYFQQAFEILANPQNAKDRDKILATMNAELSPSELSAFMAYADTRSRMSERYKMPLGQDEKAKYKSPEQFRKMLGLGE